MTRTHCPDTMSDVSAGHSDRHSLSIESVRVRVRDEPVQPRIYTLRQAAQYLNASYGTVRDWVLAGRIRALTLPPRRPRQGERQKREYRSVRIDVRELDRFIEVCQR